MFGPETTAPQFSSFTKVGSTTRTTQNSAVNI